MLASSSAPAVLQQVLPVLLFFVLPYLALRFFAFTRPRAGSVGMALGALLPWNWGTAHSGHEKELGSGNGSGSGTGKNSNGRRV
ncbi:hypothetical protein K438DRAFT_1822034, partial [Mycena galopus ATCC 62051]